MPLVLLTVKLCFKHLKYFWFVILNGSDNLLALQAAVPKNQVALNLGVTHKQTLTIAVEILKQLYWGVPDNPKISPEPFFVT